MADETPGTLPIPGEGSEGGTGTAGFLPGAGAPGTSFGAQPGAGAPGTSFGAQPGAGAPGTSFGAQPGAGGFGTGAGPGVGGPPPGFSGQPMYAPPGAMMGGKPPNNPLAVAGFICSLVFFCGITEIVGLVLGLVSLSQIKKSGGAQGGRGMAIAAVAISSFFIVAGIIYAIIVIAVVHHCNTSTSNFCTNLNTNNGG